MRLAVMVTVDEGARVAQARASEDAEPGRRRSKGRTVLEADLAPCSSGIEGKKGRLRLDAGLELTVAGPSCAP